MKTGKMKTSKMKTSINLKTRKMKNNYLKLVMMAAVMLSASIGFAQTTDTTDTGLNKGLGDGASVRVIDNKGTIKYLQTNNGITSITSTAPGNKTTTTWQLGGTLTSATNIATGANEFKITLDSSPATATAPGTQGTFIIDGVETVTVGAALTTVDGEIANTSTNTGYTFLVRDEATGQTKKLLASDLITGIRDEYTQGSTDATGNVDINVTGLPIIDANNNFKLSVYRNGVKLRFGVDFTATTVDTLNILWDATDLPMYAGDIIEVHYLN